MLTQQQQIIDRLTKVLNEVENGKEFARFALTKAAENGQLDVLKWLTETFELTVEDVTQRCNYAFCIAAENGHIEILKWMDKTFDLDIKSSFDKSYCYQICVQKRIQNCWEQ